MGPILGVRGEKIIASGKGGDQLRKWFTKRVKRAMVLNVELMILSLTSDLQSLRETTEELLLPRDDNRSIPTTHSQRFAKVQKIKSVNE